MAFTRIARDPTVCGSVCPKADSQEKMNVENCFGNPANEDQTLAANTCLFSPLLLSFSFGKMKSALWIFFLMPEV